MRNIMRLGDVASYINGFPFKPSDWSDMGVPIIRIQDLTGNGYQMNRFDGKYDAKYEVRAGDVLISWSASLGVYVWKLETAVLNQHIFKVRFDKVDVDKDFFVYQVECLLKKAARQAHGATMRHLTKPVFDGLPFYLPPKEEQKRIAVQLNAITHLISLRQRQAEKLDELVKARFVEMFGDPVLNCLHTAARPMTEICQIIDGDRGKNYPKADDFFDKGDCLFLNAKNVTKAGFNFDECMFITKDKDNVLRKGKLQRGDIILTTRGTIGNLAFYTDDVPYSDIRINSGMVILRMNREYINPIYFIEQFKMQLENIKRKIASGTAQPQLPISTMNKIKIIIPDIRLQANFANFVHEVDREKERIQRSAALLETLKRSLMQQYFG